MGLGGDGLHVVQCTRAGASARAATLGGLGEGCARQRLGGGSWGAGRLDGRAPLVHAPVSHDLWHTYGICPASRPLWPRTLGYRLLEGRVPAMAHAPAACCNEAQQVPRQGAASSFVGLSHTLPTWDTRTRS